MHDTLKDVLTKRAGAAPPEWSQPNDSASVPPKWKRWDTANKMIDGYQNGWNPNPILIRLLEGNK